MRTSDFWYELPPELIAQKPLEDRSSSRLLVLHRVTGEIEHRMFVDAPDHLVEGDLLVMNDTRVSAKRLLGHRFTGGSVEALLLRDHGEGSYEALTRPAKKLKTGEVLFFTGGLEAKVTEDIGEGKKRLLFEQPDARSQIEQAGQVPLPPYITESLADPARYQTVYSRSDGSAAAPTAGLHFTHDLLSALASKGVETASVTLDVGLDTFRPIASESVEDHEMHGERCSVPRETAKAVNASKGRVVAVGTTTVRTLESFAQDDGTIETGERSTSLFITPGYRFKAVQAMFTNFHMPGTTLMLLVSAFAGRENVMRAYREAVDQKYRFLSFGDAMLII